ncbi:MAG: hypothetical protein LBT83_00010 [Tannerella sp.]|jgi:hypothetical protein|nr:hypothetical protein [Tannerella sp.]
MEALKLKQQQSPFAAQELPRRQERGWDVEEDNHSDVRYTLEEVWDEMGCIMIDHYGETMRLMLNEERAKREWKLL